ncbi:hypothetical protein EW093_01760 [Thiospirochaeta perfilievii]|uniref:DUF4747 family protein n=1 Tax=Thiospirochaeta perfilievii TaxID=252967 RepID=A0A5C1QBD7_9SPIO|nr:hypothetical protein [Thiospirochaeta perfilievii]QEN03482.1 hypothetical protein EW093_01760 [Thiospirochaeta perfilievii]
MSIIAKLDVFTLKIREKGNKENYLNFNDVGGFNLLNEISFYLGKNIYLFKIDNEAERTSRIEKNELIENSLFCRIKVGKFGESSEIVDTLSGSGIFHKEREHSDTIPLFFHIYVTEKSDMAILHIEKCNNRSLIPEIRNILSTVLEGLREDLFIYELRPLRKTLTLDELIKKSYGSINKISLTIDQNINDDYLEPTVLTIKSKPRKDFSDKIINNLISCSKSKNYNELKSLLPKALNKIDIQNVILGIRLNDKGNITVNLSEPIQITNSYIVSNDSLNIDKFGHPSYKYLKEYSSSLM